MESRKTFRSWKPHEYAHQPVTPAEVLPEDDLAFFLLDVVPQLDLSPIYAYYERETRGAPPYDVAMMVTLGNLALDGSKFRANASRHKAMSYGYMKKEVERLRAEVAALFEQAERTDGEQDAAWGSRRGDELPDDKAQTNFTDPEAKIMKTSNKGFDYCINAQAVVDEEHQIIVAAEATSEANDKQQAVPMVEATLDNLKAGEIESPKEEEQAEAPAKRIPISMDSGYFSEDNVKNVETLGVDPHIATGRQKHHTPRAPEVEGPPPAHATVKEQMAHKLRTPSGRACYAKRKHIVEPVFGQIKHARGFRQFLLRGLNNVGAEWKLLCLTHNLLKIWRYQFAITQN